MYRISVTTLEKFRRYLKNLTARDNEEELIQSIRGLFFGNDKTQVGEAYHKVLEADAFITDNGLIVDIGRNGEKVEFFFTAEQIEPAAEFWERHPHMIHEIPVKKVYQTKYGPVLISGRVDGQDGLETEDKKCKFGNVNTQDYIDSYQWRYYLDMLQTSVFFYDVFEVRGFDCLTGGQPYQLPGVSFHAYDRIPCHRYEQMGYDCLALLNDFLDYIELRQLWVHLKKADPLAIPSI